jgi:hypothetical protein
VCRSVQTTVAPGDKCPFPAAALWSRGIEVGLLAPVRRLSTGPSLCMSHVANYKAVLWERECAPVGQGRLRRPWEHRKVSADQ